MQLIITRSREENLELTNKINGFEITNYPCIEYIAPTDNYQALDSAIRSNHLYDWVFFLSKRAAEMFFLRLIAIGGQFFHLAPSLRIACVGESTAKFVKEEIGFPVDLVPSKHNAEALFAEFNTSQTGTILLVREESLINEEVPINGRVVAGYKTQLPKAIELSLENSALIMITSSQIAKNFAELSKTLYTQINSVNYKFISIGPKTTATIKSLYPNSEILESTEASIEAMIELMLKYKHGR